MLYRLQLLSSQINRVMFPQASREVVIANLQLYLAISHTVRDSATVTIKREYQVICDLLNGVISSDLV